MRCNVALGALSVNHYHRRRRQRPIVGGDDRDQQSRRRNMGGETHGGRWGELEKKGARDMLHESCNALIANGGGEREEEDLFLSLLSVEHSHAIYLENIGKICLYTKKENFIIE
jgi:hypothetical protein